MLTKGLSSLVLILFFSLVVIPVYSQRREGDSLYTPRLRKTSESLVKLEDLRLKSLDGQDFDWRQAEGKTIFINFWSTQCGTCLSQMPSLQRLYDKVSDQVVFLFITDEAPAQVKTLLESQHYSFSAYLLSGTTFSIISNFSGDAIPHVYIVPASRKCAFYKTGSADWDNQETIDFLKNLSCRSKV